MRIGISGHRPHSFHDKLASMRQIEKLTQDLIFGHVGPKKRLTFLTGGAQGSDLWSGSAALRSGAALELYLPCPLDGYSNRWDKNARTVLFEQALSARKVWTASHRFSIESLFVRNREIVNNCDMLVVFWDENKKTGGTVYTIDYALWKKKPVYNALNNWKKITRKS